MHVTVIISTDPFNPQVRHKYTDQVMVMKEMKRVTEDAKCTFLKEVGLYIGFSCECEHTSLHWNVVGSTSEVPKSSQRASVHRDSV